MKCFNTECRYYHPHDEVDCGMSFQRTCQDFSSSSDHEGEADEVGVGSIGLIGGARAEPERQEAHPAPIGETSEAVSPIDQVERTQKADKGENDDTM